MAAYEIDRREWKSILATATLMLCGVFLGVLLDRLWAWVDAIVWALVILFAIFAFRAKDLRGALPFWYVVHGLQACAAAYAGIQFTKAIDNPSNVQMWVGGLFATGIFVAFEVLRRAFLDWVRSR